MLPIDLTEMLKGLDKYIVGQENAKKKLVKTLLFNFQRLLLDEEERKRVRKRNIILMGPTGSGKTEMARILSEILGLPFCRVSATDFTMTGFKGDDPTDVISVHLLNEVKSNFEKYLKGYMRVEAARRAMERLRNDEDFQAFCRRELNNREEDHNEDDSELPINEEELYLEILDWESEQAAVELEKILELISEEDLEEDDDVDNEQRILKDKEEEEKLNYDDTFDLESERILQQRKEKNKKVDWSARFRRYYEEELVKLFDLVEKRQITSADKKWLKRLMESSVVFIDEFDKLFSVRLREDIEGFYLGVQKHFLTLVEGCTVTIKSLSIAVDTTNITFIVAGTFENVDSQDLISELKGRFPVHIQVKELVYKDYLKIVRENEVGLKCLRTLYPECNISITDSALREIAKWCDKLNKKEYLGARRLDEIEQVIYEYVTDLILFEKKDDIKITKKTVNSLLKKHFENSLFDKKDNSASVRIGFV